MISWKFVISILIVLSLAIIKHKYFHSHSFSTELIDLDAAWGYRAHPKQARYLMKCGGIFGCGYTFERMEAADEID